MNTPNDTNWVLDPPTKAGLYLHWNGEDQVPGIQAPPNTIPTPVSVVHDGFNPGLRTEKGCFFYKPGWYGWVADAKVDELRGWWLPLPEPALSDERWTAAVPTQTGLWWHRPVPPYEGADQRPQLAVMPVLIAHNRDKQDFYVECGTFFYQGGMSTEWTNAKGVKEAGGLWSQIFYPPLPTR